MKARDIFNEDGRIVKGVNTTADVGPNEIKTQAAKFGNTVDKDGVPPTLSKKVKGASTNVAFNLGLTEGFNPVGWLKSAFNPDPQYKAWKKMFKQNPAQAKKMFKANHRQYLAIYQNESISEKYNKVEDQHPNEQPLGPETKPTMPAGSIRIKVSDVYDWYKLGQHISDLPNLDKNDFGKGPPEAVISFGSEEEEHKYIKLLQKLGLEILDVDPRGPDAPGVEADPTYNTENIEEGYKLKLERDEDIDVLHIIDTKSGKRIEVRGKKGYETNGYDPNDKLHQVLDKVGRAASVSDMMNGDVVHINPRHPQGPDAINTAKDVLQTENFADGKKKGKSRPGRVKRAGASCNGSVTQLRKRAKNASGEKAKMYHWCANMKAGKKK